VRRAPRALEFLVLLVLLLSVPFELLGGGLTRQRLPIRAEEHHGVDGEEQEQQRPSAARDDACVEQQLS
jgi:hypothetical protein